jgi:hypothetical protein
MLFLKSPFLGVFMHQGDRINMNIQALYSELTVQAMNMRGLRGQLAGISTNFRPTLAPSPVNS